MIVDAAARSKCAAKTHGLLIASDNITANLDVYCGPGSGKVPANEKPFKTIVGVAGWGLAVEPERNQLAVGGSDGTISLYSLPNLKLLSTITASPQGSSGFVASGLSYDSAGGLYATNYLGPSVLYWADPSGGGAPSCTANLKTITYAFFVVASEGSADVYGLYENSSNVPAVVSNVTNLSTCTGETETQIATLANLDDKTGFPGGLSTNLHHEVLANDQFGTLYDLGKFPGGLTAKACSWAPATSQRLRRHRVRCEANRHLVFGRPAQPDIDVPGRIPIPVAQRR